MRCFPDLVLGVLIFYSTRTSSEENSTSAPKHGASELQKALRFVEEVQSETTCSEVVYLDVVLDHKRWKQEALLVLEVANLITALWRVKQGNMNYSIAADDMMLYRSVRSIVTFSPSAFGAVICFDKYQYKDYKLFCPYAFKNMNRNGSIEVFDIALGEGEGYDYTRDNNAIWWHDPKRKAMTLTPEHATDYYAVRLNSTTKDKLRNFSLPVVRYSDGVWTRPYFDCFGGKIWMVTYLAPFFNETDQFLGVVSLDIELSAVDINQCDVTDDDDTGGDHKTETASDSKLVEFLGTHRCKPSTQCKYIPHKGFTRGSYRCECKKGFYFPENGSTSKGFNGLEVEHAYDKLLNGSPRAYQEGFDCLRCSEGCRECVDDSPCNYSVKMMVRVFLMSIHGIIMVMAIVVGVVVYYYRHHKVIRASSPRFLILSITGVVIMYTKLCFRFPANLSVALCLTEQWFHQMGFVTAYSSIIIKTWRVAVIFRVRSAQRMALTDAVLMRRVLLIVAAYAVFMMVWTSTSPPNVAEHATSAGLFFKRCVEQVWLEIIAIIGQLGLLTWGMYVCYQVRNAPSAYNESKFVSWAIYNAMFVTCFETVLRFMIRNNTTPDVMFALEFVFLHSTATTMLLLILVHKFLHIRKVKKVTLECQSAENAPNTIDRMYVNVDDNAAVTEDQEELLAQVERLQKKVAVLEAQLQKGAGRKGITNKRLRFANMVASTSAGEQHPNKNENPESEAENEELGKKLTE